MSRTRINNVTWSCWIVFIKVNVFNSLRSPTCSSTSFILWFLSNWSHISSTTKVSINSVQISCLRSLNIRLIVWNFIVHIVCCVSKFCYLCSEKVGLIMRRDIDLMHWKVKWCWVWAVLIHSTIYWCTQVISIFPSIFWMISSSCSNICLSSSQSISWCHWT